MALAIEQAAQAVLARAHRHGFDAVRVSVGQSLRQELNVAHNEVSLLRSGERHALHVVGLKDSRRAMVEGSDLGDAAIDALLDELWTATLAAPQDEANALSAGQHARIVHGPLEADRAMLTTAMQQLLDWRVAHAGAVMLEEALAAHVQLRQHTLTSGGSDLAAHRGWYELSLFGLARDGGHSSSFNYCGGTAEALTDAPQRFGCARVMRDLVRQVHTRPLGTRFVGDVVFTPNAVASLIGWLMDQLRDGPLIDGSSLYRERVGEPIASPLLTLESRYDAPGCAPLSADAFNTPPVVLLDGGRLRQLMPSLYGSRKTGLPHQPVADSGWSLRAGGTPLAAMIAGVSRGALVDRLSMGDPAPNGDFAGVIKNSFRIERGEVGQALAETMISGNVAQMLRDVIAVSSERLDSGTEVLPWLRIGGLHFS